MRKENYRCKVKDEKLFAGTKKRQHYLMPAIIFLFIAEPEAVTERKL